MFVYADILTLMRRGALPQIGGGGVDAVNGLYLLALVIAVGLSAYLFAALLRPEKF